MALMAWSACPAASADATYSIEPRFSPDEMALVRSLWIGNLGAPLPDPSNRVADDPRAAALGRLVRRMHESGIDQRDLAPNNFLWRRAGEPSLLAIAERLSREGAALVLGSRTEPERLLRRLRKQKRDVVCATGLRSATLKR